MKMKNKREARVDAFGKMCAWMNENMPNDTRVLFDGGSLGTCLMYWHRASWHCDWFDKILPIVLDNTIKHKVTKDKENG